MVKFFWNFPILIYKYANRLQKTTNQMSSANNKQVIKISNKTKKPLTPYQGDNKCFGHFKCSCGKAWKSGHTWANSSQQCNSCNSNVYPFVQVKLQKKNNAIKTKPHYAKKWQVCTKLGRDCTLLFKIKTTKKTKKSDNEDKKKKSKKTKKVKQ